MARTSIALLSVVLGLAATAAGAQDMPAAPPLPDRGGVNGTLPAEDIAVPPGLPAIGKWMIDRNGVIAHWLDETVRGRRLREPINVIVVDAAAAGADEAKRRLVAAAKKAGYPARFGHSTGYRGFIGNQLYAQLPAGRDDAFSNDVFEVSNNHGRLFGPYTMDGVYVFVGAFSREEVRPYRRPAHRYALFNRARDDFSQRLDRKTPFKLSGFVKLDNAIVGEPGVTTGDHDGLAVLLRAGR